MLYTVLFCKIFWSKDSKTWSVLITRGKKKTCYFTIRFTEFSLSPDCASSRLSPCQLPSRCFHQILYCQEVVACVQDTAFCTFLLLLQDQKLLGFPVNRLTSSGPEAFCNPTSSWPPSPRGHLCPLASQAWHGSVEWRHESYCLAVYPRPVLLTPALALALSPFLFPPGALWVCGCVFLVSCVPCCPDWVPLRLVAPFWRRCCVCSRHSGLLLAERQVSVLSSSLFRRLVFLKDGRWTILRIEFLLLIITFLY